MVLFKSFENLGLRRLPIRLIGNDMQAYREGQYVIDNVISLLFFSLSVVMFSLISFLVQQNSMK